ncbi:transposase [Streptomyces sp. NPDC020800]|uniref:transposase n=1 Tax=Streptomyces sp. NPDC020800 TaxID=3365092 RepID=UPI00379EC20D
MVLQGSARPEATRTTLCLRAQRNGQLTEQIQDLEDRLTRLAERHAPQLLMLVGIGPDTAVTLLITVGDNPEGLGSEASFAALCRVSPASSPSRVRGSTSAERRGTRHGRLPRHGPPDLHRRQASPSRGRRQRRSVRRSPA